MSSTISFNILQINRKVQGQPPLKCHCKQCEPGMVFTCDLCERLMPWCMGAADDRPDVCDECYASIEALEDLFTGGAS